MWDQKWGRMGGHAENPSGKNDLEVAASLESGNLRKGLIILVCRDVVSFAPGTKACGPAWWC